MGFGWDIAALRPHCGPPHSPIFVYGPGVQIICAPGLENPPDADGDSNCLMFNTVQLSGGGAS